MGGHHPALAGCEVLGGIKTEHRSLAAMATYPVPGADGRAVIIRPSCVRAVFNYPDAILLGQRPDSVHVTWQARNVNWDNSARSIGNPCSNRCRVDIAIGPDVSKYRRGTGMQDDIDRRAKSQWSRDDLHALTDIEGHEGQMQSGRARVDRLRMWSFDVV